MKTLAMYLIIAGHSNVPGNKYIYVFSVPCFFIISGFLTKVEDKQVFWRKLWWNLVVPMIIIVSINLMYNIVLHYIRGTFDISMLWQGPLLSLIGMQGNDYNNLGLGAMWFVYTLILCKIILQHIPNSNKNVWLLFINLVFILTTILIHKKGLIILNSYTNVLLSMPFFSIGYALRPHKENFSNLQVKYIICIIIASVLCLLFCGRNNNIVMLYRCDYGSNILLCVSGALAGTSLVYAVSLLLQSFICKTVSTIAGGTLIILGFHFQIILLLSHIIPTKGLLLYVESFFLLIAFIPIIKFTQRYFPIVYGKLRIEKI